MICFKTKPPDILCIMSKNSGLGQCPKTSRYVKSVSLRLVIKTSEIFEEQDPIITAIAFGCDVYLSTC